MEPLMMGMLTSMGIGALLAVLLIILEDDEDIDYAEEMLKSY